MRKKIQNQRKKNEKNRLFRQEKNNISWKLTITITNMVCKNEQNQLKNKKKRPI